ncbi:MAG: bifunctional folylpolyglutamate synthase/dihydrofolate synthase [Chloroflexi bacterium]|nr:bifunctional folylpolyglutamate synthase/dihydrofolate synthase [Chloroflexota bacterium]
MTYQDALRYLQSFTNYEQQPAQAYAAEHYDLRRMAMLLRRLGDPHLGRVTVHIAGTKGKGSVAAMMASVLEAAGYRTGLFTSPHLCDLRERVRLSGRAISPADLATLVEQLHREVESYHQEPVYGRITTFELLTALAFLHFQRQGAAAQVLEAGMGGRLDATNVVPQPDLCIITPVSYDHVEVLGATLDAIAGEKAGIIKPGVPVIMAPQDDAARTVIAQRCYQQGAPLVDVASRAKWARLSQTFEGQSVQVRGLKTRFQLTTPLLGAFQAENAAVVALAVEALREHGVAVTRVAVEQGVARVRWPGRLQVLEREPLLLLDGAHNGASARCLCEALQSDFPHRRAILVVATLSDKDQDAIARELAPATDLAIVTRVAHPRATPTEALAAAFRHRNVAVQVADAVASALAVARAEADEADMICATGSLYLAGQVLTLLGRAEEALDIFSSSPEHAAGPTGVIP